MSTDAIERLNTYANAASSDSTERADMRPCWMTVRLTRFQGVRRSHKRAPDSISFRQKTISDEASKGLAAAGASVLIKKTDAIEPRAYDTRMQISAGLDILPSTDRYVRMLLNSYRTSSGTRLC
jgi:hypothetical protein